MSKEPFAEAKVGDKVWDVAHGYGKVVVIEINSIDVKFGTSPFTSYKHSYLFTGHGVERGATPNRTLYHQEMQVVAPLVYKDEPPDKEGWWWWENPETKKAEALYVRRIFGDHWFEAYSWAQSKEWLNHYKFFSINVKDYRGRWAGPISEPGEKGGEG